MLGYSPCNLFSFIRTGGEHFPNNHLDKIINNDIDFHSIKKESCSFRFRIHCPNHQDTRQFSQNERKVRKETELEMFHYIDADHSRMPRVNRTYWPATAEDRVV